MAAVLAFFEERRGRLHGFLWRDGLDFSSNGGVPTALDQTLGTGDGTRTSFQLSKRYGAAFDPYLRPITRPVAGSVRVAVAGVELMSGWSVDVASGVIGFSAPPAPGAAVTAGFLFDVPVRFDTDRLDVELTSFDGAEAPSIPLLEIVP
ncbi:MAG: hypothetical protein B7Z15_22050 [Rhizobiales bacterium 32-66-8]|nr:MAG: hypothetical protein B7Z15_22050 [Rhizobiales bacterium 32-66-8]